jgi:hypothetical protein
MIWRRIVAGVLKQDEVGLPAFAAHYPLIVAGAGTAGAYAVLAAARLGVAVLGIDKNAGVGGMGTYGYVSGYYFGSPGGLHVGLDERAEALRAECLVDAVEARKYLLENEARDLGAAFLFEAQVTGVYLEDETVRGVSVLTQAGVTDYACSLCIDATAEGMVCRAAGCTLTSGGRASDGLPRPYTSVKVWLNEEKRIGRTNHDSGTVDPYDPDALSRAILTAHACQMLDVFRHEPGKVLFLAPQIGIRCGRRIQAEFMITMADILQERFTAEPLFLAFSDFDKHGKDNALESDLMQLWTVGCNLSTACWYVPVPARALLPAGVGGLIAAGRHLGVDYDAASLVRMKRDMHKCGESAGTLAALAIRLGVAPQDVPYPELQKILQASGCLPDPLPQGVWFDDNYRRGKIEWLTEREQIRQALSGDRPGVALYSCYRLGDAILPDLKQWLDSGEPMLAKNSALALGLCGSMAGCGVLRTMIRQRDSFYYKDNRRTNQLRATMALYAAGRLGDIALIPELETILCDEREIERPLYHEITEPIYAFNTTRDFNAVYFQIVSSAALALVRIIQQRPSWRETGVAILRRAFATDRHNRMTTPLPPGTMEYAVVEHIRDYVLRFVAQEQEQ